MITGDAMLSLDDGISVQHLGQGEGAVVLMVGSGELFTCNDSTAALRSGGHGFRRLYCLDPGYLRGG